MAVLEGCAKGGREKKVESWTINTVLDPCCLGNHQPFLHSTLFSHLLYPFYFSSLLLHPHFYPDWCPACSASSFFRPLLFLTILLPLVYSQPTYFFFFSISHLSSIFPFFAHPPIRIVFSFCPVREFDPYTLCRPFSPPSYRVGPTYWMQLLRTVRFVAMVTI